MTHKTIKVEEIRDRIANINKTISDDDLETEMELTNQLFIDFIKQVARGNMNYFATRAQAKEIVKFIENRLPHGTL